MNPSIRTNTYHLTTIKYLREIFHYPFKSSFCPLYPSPPGSGSPWGWPAGTLSIKRLPCLLLSGLIWLMDRPRKRMHKKEWGWIVYSPSPFPLELLPAGWILLSSSLCQSMFARDCLPWVLENALFPVLFRPKGAYPCNHLRLVWEPHCNTLPQLRTLLSFPRSVQNMLCLFPARTLIETDSKAKHVLAGTTKW